MNNSIPRYLLNSCTSALNFLEASIAHSQNPIKSLGRGSLIDLRPDGPTQCHLEEMEKIIPGEVSQYRAASDQAMAAFSALNSKYKPLRGAALSQPQPPFDREILNLNLLALLTRLNDFEKGTISDKDFRQLIAYNQAQRRLGKQLQKSLEPEIKALATELPKVKESLDHLLFSLQSFI